MKVRAVVGVPGAGKTRAVADEVRRYILENPDLEKPVVLSFTRAAAAEIAARNTGLARDRARTIHSLSFGFANALAREGGQAIHIAEKSAEAIRDFNASVSPRSYRLTGPLSASDPYAASRGAVGPELFEEVSCGRHRLSDESSWSYDARRWYEKWRKFKEDGGYLDFTDLIELALEQSVHCPGKPSAIWFDEAQDASRLMLALVRKWAGHTSCGMLTLIGDPRQSLYVWSGADPTIFDRVEDVTLLNRTYRVPSVIMKLANQWASRLSNTIDAIPRREGGIVERSVAKWQSPLRAIEIAEEAEGTTIIQASCGYMLKPTLAELRQRGVPFANPWASEGKNGGTWNPLRRSTRKGRHTIVDRILALVAPLEEGREQVNWTVGELNLWASLLRSKDVLNRGAKKEMDDAPPGDWVTTEDVERWFCDLSILEAVLAEDEREAMRLFSERLPPKRAAQIGYYAEIVRQRGFAGLREEPRIFIGTCHSFKGAEADTVIIYPDLSVAGQKEWDGKDRESVVRMGYVALTRAKERVVICEKQPGKRGHGFMPFFGGN